MDLWESIAGCAASSVVDWLVCIQTLESMAGCNCVKRVVVGMHTDIVKVCLAAIGIKKLSDDLVGTHTDIEKEWLGVIVLKAQCYNGWYAYRQEVSVGRLGIPPFSPSSRIAQGVTVQVFHLGALIGLSNSYGFHRVFLQKPQVF